MTRWIAAALVVSAIAAFSVAAQPAMEDGLETRQPREDASVAVPVKAAAAQFVPQAVFTPLGTPVEWEAVLLTHTVTTTQNFGTAIAGQANDPGNGDADPDTFDRPLGGAKVTHAFGEAGVYWYFCRLHFQQGMVGVVVAA